MMTTTTTTVDDYVHRSIGSWWRCFSPFFFLVSIENRPPAVEQSTVWERKPTFPTRAALVTTIVLHTNLVVLPCRARSSDQRLTTLNGYVVHNNNNQLCCSFPFFFPCTFFLLCFACLWCSSPIIFLAVSCSIIASFIILHE